MRSWRWTTAPQYRPSGRETTGRHLPPLHALSLAIFRHHGVPARGRGGFAAYFNPGKFEDHWVCEFWKADERAGGRCWTAELDDVFLRHIAIRHDIHDVPRDQFLTASDAWRKCRSGELDPTLFGIEFYQLRGLWFIAGCLMRDLATLNGFEILPWDVWDPSRSPMSCSPTRNSSFLTKSLC